MNGLSLIRVAAAFRLASDGVSSANMWTTNQAYETTVPNFS